MSKLDNFSIGVLTPITFGGIAVLRRTMRTKICTAFSTLISLLILSEPTKEAKKFPANKALIDVSVA